VQQKSGSGACRANYTFQKEERMKTIIIAIAISFLLPIASTARADDYTKKDGVHFADNTYERQMRQQRMTHKDIERRKAREEAAREERKAGLEAEQERRIAREEAERERRIAREEAEQKRRIAREDRIAREEAESEEAERKEWKATGEAERKEWKAREETGPEERKQEKMPSEKSGKH